MVELSDPAPHTLRPSDRVRRRPDFLRAYEQGVKHHGRYMTVFARPNALSGPRVGVSATRKIGSAVVRNRAKRRARDLFRRARPAACVDLIIIPRRDFASVPFERLEADYHAAVRRVLARPRSRTGAVDAS